MRLSVMEERAPPFDVVVFPDDASKTDAEPTRRSENAPNAPSAPPTTPTPPTTTTTTRRTRQEIRESTAYELAAHLRGFFAARLDSTDALAELDDAVAAFLEDARDHP